jgi:hypothetical protein
MLEMALLSRLTQLIGDPVLVAATTITTFLLGSGAGSLLVGGLGTRDTRGVVMAIAGIGVGAGALFALIAPLSRWCAGWSDPWRVVAAVIIMLPPAFLMGMPMPSALRRLNRSSPALVPWAWGVNGFASVLAAPLSAVIGMTWGLGASALAALTCYLAAAVLYARLPGSPARGELPGRAA